MLKLRIITALILLPLLLVPVFWGPYWLVISLFTVAILFAAWEWTALCGLISNTGRISYLVFALIGIAVLLLNMFDSVYIALSIYGIAIAMWFYLAIFPLRQYRSGLATPNSNALISRKLVLGIFILLPAWMAITELYFYNVAFLFYVFGIVWIADIGAYFSGKAWGKHKLALHVSPGKTWEGFMGGMAMVCLWSVLGIWFLKLNGPAIYWFIVLSLLTGLLSVIGDLYESLLKRQIGVKDSGWILPGHGGMLDRIDSMLVAAPVFVFGLHLLLLSGYLQ